MNLPTPRRKLGGVPTADPASVERTLQDISAEYFRRCAKTSPRDAEHATLAKLWVAAKRLHEALKDGTVADAIIEISSNLIGCEQMALVFMQEEWDEVAVIGSTGLTTKQLEAMRVNGKGIIEETPAGDIYIKGDAEKPDPLLSSFGITARVSFRMDLATTGAIVFFDLLPQRNGLDSGDRELLKLLCTYAGPCFSTGAAMNQTIFK